MDEFRIKAASFCSNVKQVLKNTWLYAGKLCKERSAGKILLRQEILRYHTPCSNLLDEDMVHRKLEAISEIPCQVNSDPHEKCNDLGTVSTKDPVKSQ